MSIRALIQDCVDGGELLPLRPLRNGQPSLRDVFVTYRVFDFLSMRGVPRHLLRKAADSRAAIDRFIAGAPISVGMDPVGKKTYAELARTRPVENGMWAFRIRDPKPQVRIFGGFAERDVFIAIDYRQRDDLDFEAALATSRLLWNDLFGENPPVTGELINDYLSDGFFPV